MNSKGSRNIVALRLSHMKLCSGTGMHSRFEALQTAVVCKASARRSFAGRRRPAKLQRAEGLQAAWRLPQSNALPPRSRGVGETPTPPPVPSPISPSPFRTSPVPAPSPLPAAFPSCGNTPSALRPPPLPGLSPPPPRGNRGRRGKPPPALPFLLFLVSSFPLPVGVGGQPPSGTRRGRRQRGSVNNTCPVSKPSCRDSEHRLPTCAAWRLENTASQILSN